MTALVAVVDHRFPDLDIEQRVLRGAHAQIEDARGLERAEVLEVCAEANAILVGARFRFDADAVARLGRCRGIVRYGIGFDNIDIAAAAAAGIWVAYVPDYCIEEVATHAIAAILALNRRLLEFDGAIRDGRWGIPDGVPVKRLSSCTLGVIGFGRIGEAVGRRAAALGLNVVAYDPMRPRAQVEAAGASVVALDELLGLSDYVSLHAPPAGEPLLGPREFGLVKPGACLINVGRADLVDEEALLRALAGGALAGAALDVMSSEPLHPPSPLLEQANVLVTPHAAWYSLESVVELRTKAAEEVLRILRGRRPRYAAVDLSAAATGMSS